MNKYVVKVSSIFSNIIEVEAEDEDMARAKAQEFLENRSENEENKESIRHYYESTFPPEHWPVITQEKYEELKSEVKKSMEAEELSQDSEDNSSNIIVP
jgi:hypothetical protein